jgi:hypothetical protein
LFVSQQKLWTDYRSNNNLGQLSLCCRESPGPCFLLLCAPVGRGRNFISVCIESKLLHLSKSEGDSFGIMKPVLFFSGSREGGAPYLMQIFIKWIQHDDYKNEIKRFWSYRLGLQMHERVHELDHCLKILFVFIIIDYSHRP